MWDLKLNSSGILNKTFALVLFLSFYISQCICFAELYFLKEDLQKGNISRYDISSQQQSFNTPFYNISVYILTIKIVLISGMQILITDICDALIKSCNPHSNPMK